MSKVTFTDTMNLYDELYQYCADGTERQHLWNILRKRWWDNR